MNPSQLLVNITAFAAVGFAVCLLSLGIWFIVRRQRRKVHLPALRVLHFENQRLPKFRRTPPPWLSFLSFLAAALAFAFFLMRPTELSFTPFDPKENRHHLVLDMSPSVSAYVSPEQYAARVLPLFKSLQQSGKVTVSSTHSLEVLEPANEDELAAYIRQHGFHRFGVRLGGFMHRLLDKLGKVDRLLIVSDGEDSTWSDFNWRFLQDQMEVVWVPVASRLPEGKANAYINAAAYVAQQDSLTMVWDVEIARTNSSGEAEGNLRVSYQGQELARVPWTMPAGKDRVTVPVSWSGEKIPRTASTAPAPLLWELQPAGDDAIAMDNSFRTELRGDKRHVLLIAEPSGESVIEDQAHHLRVALEVMGMRVTRVDKVPTQDKLSSYNLVVAMGGLGTGVTSFCPARLAEKTSTAAPIFWLAPYDVQADYSELCQCYGNLVEGKPLTNHPLYCEEAQHRDHWVGILSSLGASQIGGAVGEVSGAIAWRGRIKDTQTPIVAFSVPLRPRAATGVGYAQLPNLVRQMLILQGLLKTNDRDDPDGQARIADASSMLVSPISPELQQRLANSNVPSGESQLRLSPSASLPSTWQGDSLAANARSSTQRKDHGDPFPWIQLVAALIIIASLTEAVLKLWRGRRRPRPQEAAWLALALLTGSLLGARPAAAWIDVTMVDEAHRPSHIAWLAREVAMRTSIDVNPTPRFFAAIAANALKEPWLWLKDTRPLLDAKGNMRVDVEAWLKRGGLLIIENARSVDALTALTRRLDPLQRSERGWQPIPPDHELLRSFHLLESLPVCQEAIWRGYHFDGRLAILAIPFSLTEALADTPQIPACLRQTDREYLARVFVNLAMVALATDYKKDQIHLPEILKRLR